MVDYSRSSHHRRAQSELNFRLPEDLDLASDPFDAPSGSFEDFRSEDNLFCTYMDMEKYLILHPKRAKSYSSDYTAAIDVWSVGCIYMELMNRKPLFAGKDHVHQMRLLTELLGTPTESDLGFVKNEDAKRYIQQLPRHPRQSLGQLFPNVHPLAIDLIDKMLSFDPTKRITVEEALAHPYLERLHDIADEPICLEPFSFEFETQHLGEEQIKDMIYQEALALNPEYA